MIFIIHKYSLLIVKDLCNLGILDGADNCPLVANPGQENIDTDSVGDACDNCINVNNDDQRDANQNGVGDACETFNGLNQDRSVQAS